MVKSPELPYIWNANGVSGAEIYDLLASQSSQVDQRVLGHGAVLFRGFGVDSVEKFQRCAEVLKAPLINYVDGNSPRTKLASKVYTTTEYPAELPISLHNELSYCNQWPARLYLCCVIAPQTGGSTPVADSRRILRDISPGIVRDFEEKGVMYVRNLPTKGSAAVGKSWQETYETEDRTTIEDHCRHSDTQWEWREDGGLRLTQKRHAIGVHPRTGERVWFNQVDQFHPSTNPPEVYEAIQEIWGERPFDMPQYACFGDGAPVADEVLAEVRAAMDANTVSLPWQVGDFMVVDNVLTAHGREPYTGARRILISMAT